MQPCVLIQLGVTSKPSPACLSLLKCCHVSWFCWSTRYSLDSLDFMMIQLHTVSSWSLQGTSIARWKTEPGQPSFIDKSVLRGRKIYSILIYSFLTQGDRLAEHACSYSVWPCFTFTQWHISMPGSCPVELPCGAAQYICSRLSDSTAASSGSVLHSDTPWQ